LDTACRTRRCFQTIQIRYALPAKIAGSAETAQLAGGRAHRSTRPALVGVYAVKTCAAAPSLPQAAIQRAVRQRSLAQVSGPTGSAITTSPRSRQA
jgi:hypothetical protein